MANFNLTTQQIKDTYEQLAQVSASLLVDGTGSLSPILTSSIINFPTEVSRSAAAAGFGQGGGSLPSGVISSSAQVVYSGITGVPSGILSSSTQIGTDISGAFTSTSASLAANIATNTSNITTKLDTSTFTSYSSSVSTRLTTDESNISTNTSNISTQTSRVDSLVSATSSYALKTEISGAFTSTSASIAVDIATNTSNIGTLTAATSSYALKTAISGAFNTSSLLVTASFSNPNLTFTKGDGTTFQQSLVSLVPTTSTSASRATSAASADTATFATSATSASYAISSSHSVSSSFATFALSTNTGFSATGSFTGSTWVFNHNLNKEYIIVDCYDSNGEEIIPQTIDLTSPNQSTITFPISVQGVALASLGSGINNIPLVSSYFNDLMFSAVDYIIDVPGDTLTPPITVSISQSGVYFISASKLPPYGQNGPRVNLQWCPEQLDSGTAKVVFYIPNLDTGTGITYKQNVSCSADYQYIWNSTTTPAATTATNVARSLTLPQISQGAGVTTMIKSDSGYVYFSLGSGWPTTGTIITGPSQNPII